MISKPTTYDIFVYGTLRSGGEYHHLYLRYCPCLLRNYRLPNYALYDYAGLYPFMVPETGQSVVGEVYRVSPATKEALDDFEDVAERLYRLVYLPGHGFHTYLGDNVDITLMPRVPGGDWLTYCSAG